MAERRFTDEEVRDILARATEVRDPSPALLGPASLTDGHADGLTLVELQDVATEVGIPASRIAEAATAHELDRAALPAPQTQFGATISTAHVVHLPRMPEADEWDRFVVRLRDTFDAVGAVRTEGSLQTWSNGFLNVMLEPLEDGARLRFQSLHGVSKGYLDGAIVAGVTGVMLGAVLAAASLFGSKPIPVGLYAMALGFLPAGAAMLAIGRSKAAKWLPERRSQFRALGEEAVRLIAEGEE